MSFFEELKRRNVFRVGVAYAVAGWVLLQVVDLVLDNVEAPGWVMDVFMLVVVLGFVVSMIVAWAYEITPEGIKREADVDRGQSITGDTGRKLDKIIIGFLAVAVVLLLADRFVRSPEMVSEPFSQSTAEQSEIGTNEKRALTPVLDPVVETPAKSIAVLPFANMSDDASNEFFSDGISEEILNALAKVKGLKVAGRTSAFAFKGRNEDLREIGEALGVNHILEGSVRKAGNKVRVTAQLIQVSDGFHLWSETFDRELTDIFAIQDEIANAILLAMKAELIGDQSIASERVDPAVYEKYLLAKQRTYSRTELDLGIAADLLKEATELDPNFAAAWAQRAIVTLLLEDDAYGKIPHEEGQQIARRFLDKALKLDENSAEALAGMGLYYRNEPGGSSVEETARKYLQRALEINPGLIDASNWLQLSYAVTGQNQKSLQILEEMVNRDPLYKPGTGNLIGSYAIRGQIETAERLLDRVRPYIRDEGYLARFDANIMLMSGRAGEALPKARTGHEFDPQDFQSLVSLNWAMLNLGMDEELAAMESAAPFFRQTSLIRLGRLEEGIRIARDFANQSGQPSTMIYFYHQSRQPKALVNFIDERWPELADLESELTGLAGFGHGDMMAIAHAYKQTGNPVKFDQAMRYIRTEHDRQVAAGFESLFLHFAEGFYWALADDIRQSLDHIEMAIEKGGNFPLSDIAITPEYDPFVGDERFKALSLRAHEQFNAQRVLAGLEPIEPDRSL
jgi:TolB-like protein